MRVDLYTKAVLTVIAGALLYLCVAVTPVGTPVSAQASASRVHIAGWVDSRGTVHQLSADDGLPMRLGAMASLGTGSAAPVTGGTTPRGLDNAPGAPAAAAPSSDQRIRCQATTQRGSQCSRMAPAGQRYCWQHAR